MRCNDAIQFAIKSEDQAARFRSNIVVAGECWEWTGSKARWGYGMFAVRISPGVHASVRAHRLSWAFANGRHPGDMCICHRCDNTKCVRPDHLFIGTQSENHKDMQRKRRNARGSSCGSAVLNEQTAKEALDALKEHGPRHVARMFGVDHSTIISLRDGKTWKHVAR